MRWSCKEETFLFSGEIDYHFGDELGVVQAFSSNVMMTKPWTSPSLSPPLQSQSVFAVSDS